MLHEMWELNLRTIKYLRGCHKQGGGGGGGFVNLFFKAIEGKRGSNGWKLIK